MKIKISFGRELTLATFSGVSRYCEVLENYLTTASDNEKDLIRKKIEDMELDPALAYEEFELAMQEHDMTFNMLLPNFFRYSFIVLLCQVIESKLCEIAELTYNHKKDLPAPPHPKNDIIKEYKKYFTNEVAILGLKWDILLDLYKVRNCIVHASGDVKGHKYESFLRQLAQNKIGIHISDPTFIKKGNLHPLYLDNDRLVLEHKYCIDASHEVMEFFEKMLDDIGFSAMQLNGL